jgi:hypothetical protein
VGEGKAPLLPEGALAMPLGPFVPLPTMRQEKGDKRAPKEFDPCKLPRQESLPWVK